VSEVSSCKGKKQDCENKYCHFHSIHFLVPFRFEIFGLSTDDACLIFSRGELRVVRFRLKAACRLARACCWKSSQEWELFKTMRIIRSNITIWKKTMWSMASTVDFLFRAAE
jgi:hypothetical protein